MVTLKTILLVLKALTLLQTWKSILLDSFK